MGSLLLDIMIKGTLALLATGAVVAALRGARRQPVTRSGRWAWPPRSLFRSSRGSSPDGTWPCSPQGRRVPSEPRPHRACRRRRRCGPGRLWAVGAAVVMASIVLGRIRIWWLARTRPPSITASFRRSRPRSVGNWGSRGGYRSDFLATRSCPWYGGSLARSCSFRRGHVVARRAPPQCPAPRARARAAT